MTPPPDSEAGPAGHGERVLLVDDEAAVLCVTSHVLTANHYHVTATKDSVAALRYFKTHADDVDLVITDMLMPDLDGAALIREVRQISPAVKIISISGLAETESASDRDAVQARLHKPYSVGELLRAVRDVLA
jgi:two-component system, cell cycle sensor histidine kinase and response regulator CckA